MNDCFERIKEEAIFNKRNNDLDGDDEEDENGETESASC